MADPTNDATAASASALSELYGDCDQEFQNLLAALYAPDRQAVSRGQVQIQDVFDLYGRTRTWSNMARVTPLAGARGSLDDTLRNNDELKSLTRVVLTRLHGLLQMATKIIQDNSESDEESETESSSGSIGDDSKSAAANPHHPEHAGNSQIALLFHLIEDNIHSLYSLSSLLRPPRVVDKYIKSVDSQFEAESVDTDSVSMHTGFSLLDECHVAEKMLEWRDLFKSTRACDFNMEDEAPVGSDTKRLTSQVINDVPWLCRRLARANTRRRDQLQYWSRRPYEAKVKAMPEPSEFPGIPSAAAPDPRQRSPETSGQTSNVKPPDPKFLQPGPRSTTSRQSFSSAAVSDLFETQTRAEAMTHYAPTNAGKGRSSRLPDPPKPKPGSLDFHCPYCGTLLSSRVMSDKQSWKRHVFRDLRPYICTFENCLNASKMYVSRHEWIHHELQIHRRHWLCKECHQTCTSRDAMAGHLHKHYDASVVSAHGKIILSLCERPASEDSEDICVICGGEHPLSLLQQHLANHMEDLSLFLLPLSYEDSDGELGSKPSLQVAEVKPEHDKTSLGSLPGLEDDIIGSISSWSKLEHHTQTSAQFGSLLAQQDEGSSQKFPTWQTASITGSDSGDSGIRAEIDAKTKYGDTALHYATEKGRWEEAEKLEVQVMETRKNKLKADHLDTLTSMANLASTYRNQGQWEEAEKLDVQVMKTRSGSLGKKFMASGQLYAVTPGGSRNAMSHVSRMHSS